MLGAKNDAELARQLGVKRSAISQWRDRGAVPAKYLQLLRNSTAADYRRALESALRLNIFGRPEAGYWLRAALAVFPFHLAGKTSINGSDLDDIEGVMIHLMGLAVTATNIGLKQEYCRDKADCDRLVALLKSDFSVEIEQITRRLQADHSAV